jgi:hypothetical protein
MTTAPTSGRWVIVAGEDSKAIAERSSGGAWLAAA